MGDSLSAGYGLEFHQSFPAQLDMKLQEHSILCEVQAFAISGDTTAGGRSRIDGVLETDPTHLLIGLGGNDALRALPTASLKENLAAIIEAAQAKGVSVFLAGMKAPPNLGRRYVEQFDRAFEEISEEFDTPLYPFFLDGVIGHPDLLLPDGIHPNADGIVVMVDRMWDYISSWLISQ